MQIRKEGGSAWVHLVCLSKTSPRQAGVQERDSHFGPCFGPGISGGLWDLRNTG